jgi:hypothetical protein
MFKKKDLRGNIFLFFIFFKIKIIILGFWGKFYFKKINYKQ